MDGAEHGRGDHGPGDHGPGEDGPGDHGPGEDGPGEDGPLARRRLACATVGSGGRVVLVHGFTQTGASWRPVSELLAPNFEVVTPDLPGHGLSSAIRVEGLAEAAALIGGCGGRATYVGYSLGGRLCLTLALADPSLVEQLVLVGTTAGIEDPGERAARRAADDALADELDPAGGAPRDSDLRDSGLRDSGLRDSGLLPGDATPERTPTSVPDFLQRWLAGPLFAHLSADQADMTSRLVNTGAGLASSLRSVGTGRQQPSWERLAMLEMPVLLVTGERDERFGALAQRMATLIGPGAAHVVVPGVGHAVPFEAPEHFARLLTGVLTGAFKGRSPA